MDSVVVLVVVVTLIPLVAISVLTQVAISVVNIPMLIALAIAWRTEARCEPLMS